MYHHNIAIPPELSNLWSERNTLVHGVGRLLVDRFFYTETYTLAEIVAYAGWVAATRWRRCAPESQLAVQLRWVKP